MKHQKRLELSISFFTSSTIMLVHAKSFKNNLVLYFLTARKNIRINFPTHSSFLGNSISVNPLIVQTKCQITSGQLSDNIFKHENSSHLIHSDRENTIICKHQYFNKTAEKSAFDSLLTKRYDESLR